LFDRRAPAALLLAALFVAACGASDKDIYAVEQTAAMWQCTDNGTLEVSDQPVKVNDWDVIYKVTDGPLKGQMILVDKDLPALDQKAYATCPGQKSRDGTKVWDGSGRWVPAD
jgi:hypothetical protein